VKESEKRKRGEEGWIITQQRGPTTGKGEERYGRDERKKKYSRKKEEKGTSLLSGRNRGKKMHLINRSNQKTITEKVGKKANTSTLKGQRMKSSVLKERER